MPEIQELLPPDNLPAFLLTNREKRELEDTYRFDELRCQLISDSCEYGPFEEVHRRNVEQVLKDLSNSHVERSLDSIRDYIRTWGKRTRESDTTFITHLERNAPEEQGGAGLNEEREKQLGMDWYRYLIQEDP